MIKARMTATVISLFIAGTDSDRSVRKGANPMLPAFKNQHLTQNTLVSDETVR